MNRVSMGMPCFCYVLKIDNFIGGGGGIMREEEI